MGYQTVGEAGTPGGNALEASAYWAQSLGPSFGRAVIGMLVFTVLVMRKLKFWKLNGEGNGSGSCGSGSNFRLWKRED